MGPFGYGSFLYKDSSCQSLFLKLRNKENISQFSFTLAWRDTNVQLELGDNPEPSPWVAGQFLLGRNTTQALCTTASGHLIPRVLRHKTLIPTSAWHEYSRGWNSTTMRHSADRFATVITKRKLKCNIKQKKPHEPPILLHSYVNNSNNTHSWNAVLWTNEKLAWHFVSSNAWDFREICLNLYFSLRKHR